MQRMCKSHSKHYARSVELIKASTHIEIVVRTTVNHWPTLDFFLTLQQFYCRLLALGTHDINITSDKSSSNRAG